MNNIIQEVPKEVVFNITPMMKIERIVSKLYTLLKLGVEVVHITGSVSKLKNCASFIGLLSKQVSIFIENIDECPACIKRYIENA